MYSVDKHQARYQASLRGTILRSLRHAAGGMLNWEMNQRVKELVGGVRGCTHITELAGALATAAFQTMAGQKLRAADQKPFQLDKCHALESTAPAVAKYYPKWYRGTEPVDVAQEGDHH